MNRRIVFGVGLTLGVSLSCFGASVPVTWNASQTPETLGPLSVSYDDGKVSQLAFGTASEDTVVISGDDMAFAAGAHIRFAGTGKIVFEIGATAPDGLVVDVPDHDIAADDLGAASVTFTKPVALVGALTLTNGTEVVAEGANGFFTDGVAVTNALVLWGGRLTLANHASLDFREPISGKEGCLFVKADPTKLLMQPSYRFMNPSAAAGKEYDIWNANWYVFVKNARLSAVTNMTSRLTSSGLDKNSPVTIFRYTNDGMNASCDVQNYYATTDANNAPGLVRGTTLRLRQNGNDIEIQTPHGYYKRNVDRATFDAGGVTYENCLGSDRPGKQDQTGAGSYVPTLIDIFCDTSVPMFFQSSLALSNTNTCEGGSVQLGVPGDSCGTYTLTVNDRRATPANGFVDVYGAKSMLELKASGDAGAGTGYSTTMRLHEGALFRAWTGAFHLGAQGPKVELYDGSRMELGADVQYASFVTFDGGLLKGPLVFCGYSSDAFWNVRGESPSVVTANEIRVGAQSNAGTWTLDVADVTGDAAPDLTVVGKLTRHTNYADSRIVKRGAGTLALSKSIAPEIAKFRLEAGLVRLENDAVVSSANANFILAGGGFEIPANVAVSLGAVKLDGGDSRIVLADGASVTLADQASSPWTSGTLSFVGPEPADPENPVCTNVRIGTSSAAVTAAQRHRLSYNGKRVRLTAEGYLEIYEKGMTLMFR